MASVHVTILDQFPCNLRPRKAKTKLSSRFRFSIASVFVILVFLVFFCSNYPSKKTYLLRPSLQIFEPDSSFTLVSALSTSVVSNVTSATESQNATHTPRFTNLSLSLEMKNGAKETSLVENTPRSSEIAQILASNRSEARKRKALHLGRNSSAGFQNSSSKLSFGGNPHSHYGTQLANRVSSSDLSRSCDIFDGKWVRTDAKPYYPPGSCPFIDREFDCFLNGRPDDGFVKWRWQPNGCQLPRLNATDFLERLRGKKMVFVGDSLNRNMWESLVCMLHQGVQNKTTVYEISGKTEFKKKGFYAFKFEEYNCSVDFVGSPFLVRESTYSTKNVTFETLRLDLIDITTPMYQDADILIFNTGHWWTHEKTSKGEDYYQEGNHVYPQLKVLQAYTRALHTWAKWVDEHINSNKTLVYFRGYSITHFRGGRWNSGGQCHKETEPIFNETYLGSYPSKMRALESVLHGMKMPVIYLNISRMTDYRKDGHPSVYRKAYASVQEQIAAEVTQDCSHWCLPGVPDTWNEMLYKSLVEAESRVPMKV